MDNSVPVPARGRRALYTSFVVTLAVLVVGGAFLGFAVYAANYTAIGSGSVNWTATSLWSSCTTTGPADACGAYPGQLANSDRVNITTSGSPLTVVVNTAIPNPVTVTNNSFNGATLDVQSGGALQLQGNSLISAVGVANFLQISGGALSNTGTLDINGPSGPPALRLNAGTLKGSGITNIGAGANPGQFNVTTSAGGATIDQQTVNIVAGSSMNEVTAGTLSLANGATINNSGTYSVGLGGAVSGAGSIVNNGTFSVTSGPGFTVGVPFSNNGTVATTTGGLTLSLNGGSTAAGHSSGTWNFGPGNTYNFGGTHTFVNAQTILGSGTMNVQPGGSLQNVGNIAAANSITLNNQGTIGFNATGQSLNVSAYTQGSTAALNLFIGPSPATTDKILSGGNANLSGTLNATTVAGYTPATGDTFGIVGASGVVSGAFTTVNAPYTGGQFVASYTAGPPGAVNLVAAPTADMLITKNGPSSVAHGQTFTYTLNAVNAGPSSATNVTVTDTLPANVTFASFTNSTGGTCTGTTTITCAAGTLAPGANAIIDLNVVATTTGTVTNTASVTASELDPNSANNSSSLTTTITPSADLTITKTGPATAAAGSTLTYTIQVTNNGPDPATNVVMTDTHPAGAPPLSASGTGWTCTIAAATVTCTTPGIGVAAVVAPITITATAPAAAGNITNTATVSATEGDPVNSNNSSSATTVVSASADIGVVKSGPASVVAGTNVVYGYTVTNNGPSNVSTITVNDTPGPGLAFVSGSAQCPAFPCTFAGLNAATSVSFNATYAVSSSATGTVSNTASVGGTGVSDPNSANNSSMTTATVTSSSDIAVAKTGPATAFPGQTITYTVSVKNIGPSDAANVVINDPTPAQTTLISSTGASCSGFPCTIGVLPAGSIATITSTYSVNNTATGAITNTATASATTPDPNNANNSASVTTTVTPKADLEITKSGPGTLPSNGAKLIFTIVVRNLGPSTANNVVVQDSPSSNLSFVANSGACTTPFPCSFATVASGATLTIQSSYNVAANATSVTNKADVSSSTADPNTSNNSSTVTITRGTTCISTPVQTSPSSGQQDVPLSGTMQWTNVNAMTYDVYFGPAGQGCATFAGTVTTNSFNYSGLTPNTDYESRIVANRAGCPSQQSLCIRWRTGNAPCDVGTPQIIAPQNNTTTGGTTRLQWNAVAGAEKYHVVVTVNGIVVVDTTTTDTFADVTIPNGNASFTVAAIAGNCTGPTAGTSFAVCGAGTPLAGVVGAPSSGRTYSVIVVNAQDLGATQYEFQEATNAAFTDAVTRTSTTPTLDYTHSANQAQVFFYRVRAFVACSNVPGPYSKTVRVVIVPERVDVKNPAINVPFGNRGLQTIQVFIPGEQTPVNFSLSSDKPWIVKIVPNAGILPPAGITVTVTIDPTALPNGTFTASIVVTTSPLTTSNARLTTNGSGKNAVPVTINLVTPVVPVNPTGPTADSLIIPAVGHAAGLNSQWRSDVRIYNASPQALQYVLNFTPQASTDVKRTTITTQSGDTTALDDIIHNWFGVGEVGDSITGVLEIRPMTLDGSITLPPGGSFFTVASSRTFNATTDGTLGQFIPPVKFTNFIGAGSRLSLQQLAQSTSYRTNFGLVEASGSPVSLILSMFNSDGSKLFDLPVNLAAGEQKQINGLLAQQGITTSDGRMEVKVAGGDGKVTAYASVIDNASEDPQLVPAQNLSNTSSRLYVVPGVADLNNGAANWRSDMRIYNSAGAPQTVNLTFFSQDNASAPQVATITVQPNEVKVLDSVVQSVFGKSNVGGMVQLTTASDSQLVVTARTYNQTANGTLGQFIKAATAAEGATTATRALNILQVEDSPRLRTNIGLAEMTGKPATVEVSVVLPDSKVTPVIDIPLGANEFRQFSVAQFGLGDIYNARVSVKVIDGQGSVTAYGSVIDQVTTDPTYVQAQ